MRPSNGFEHLELRETNSCTDSVSGKSITFRSINRRKKVAIAAVCVLVVAAALVIGLAVGLSQSDDGSSSSNSRNVGTVTSSPPTVPVSTPGTLSSPPVLLVSLDGFRASYLSYNVTPTLQRLIGEGVHTPRLLSAYPTLTFPNHYTIVTGLYPESHGIVDNKMFDVSFQRYYRLGSPEASRPEWYGGEPMWLTAQRQGKKSACYFWVASDVPIGGEYPTEYRKYNGSVPFTERVDTVLDWLSRPADTRPDFLTLYFNEPDHTGHAKGPAPSPEMLSTLRMVDGTISRLVNGLKDRGLYNAVNLIIVADHGMSARSCSRQVKLKDYFNSTELQNMYVFSSASGRISNRYKSSGGHFSLLDPPYVSKDTILARVSGQRHIAVYDKGQLPRRLHYANNARIDDIVIKMEDGWVFSKYGSSGSSCSGGTHGWDSRYDSMSGLFIARGPAFIEGLVVPPFENIELYNLMADLLKITAAPNNGTRGSLNALLKSAPTLPTLPDSTDNQCRQQSKISASALHKYCNCSVPQTTSQTVPQRLQFQPEEREFVQPVLLVSNLSTVCLSDDLHTTAYSTRLHMPLWTSFIVANKQDITQDAESCTVPNSLLPSEEQDLFLLYNNGKRGVVPAVLFAATSGCGNTALSSDVIPMTETLKEDLWQELWQMLRTTTNSSYPSVSVTVGPVFDYNFDGLADDVTNITTFADETSRIPLPSHYFAVLARCPERNQNLSQCAGDLDLLSFVLPNEQNKNGQSKERRLLENVARVRDIELLTGLRFFPGLDPALSARLRTHVPLSIWTKPGSWADVDLCPNPPASLCHSSYQPLLLISLDGFRADYLVKYNRTPTIDRLIRCGVHSPYMRSAYPTKTFPNHYTIVTGLFPESHGIVDNNMYDFNISQKFCLSCDQAKDPAWWGGEPIWLTAKRHGLITATYFWPGSDVAIQGEYPDHYRKYTGGVSYTERVQTVLQWMKLPAAERPRFITLYFDEPDHAGHAVGPDSPQIGEKLAEVDAAIAELMEGLYQQDMQHCVNIMVIADHGMSGVSCDRLMPLSADISREDLGKMYVYDGPVGRISNKYRYGRSNNIPIVPPQINISTIVNKLECSHRHMRVYTKSTLPMRHHYTNNDRIDDVLLDADDRWLISRSGSTRYCTGGNHGYDNLYASMHALFLAYGPVFKTGVEIEPFENIELYNLMADILGVTPAPNNGTEGSLYDMLRVPPSLPNSVPTTSPLCNNATTILAVYQRQREACNCSQTAAVNNSAWKSLLGEPVSSSDGPSLCVNHLSDHSMAYDEHMMAPAWLAFDVNVTNSTMIEHSEAPCVVRDSWLPLGVPTLNTSLLEGTEYLPASLLFGSGSHCGAAMSSEMVPMLAEFKTGLWRKVEQLVADYSARYGEIAVTVGPVFNEDATGLWQGRTNRTRLVGGVYPVPTHFFLVLGKCGTEAQSLPCWESLQLLSFLIPHVNTPSNCQNFSGMLRENVARVRDIEIATGLQFFSDLPVNQSAKLRTFLPTQIWNGSTEINKIQKPGNWTDQPCPPRNHTDRNCPSDYQPVLLVSLDGFKPQYLGRGLTPVIDRLMTCGVHSPYMRSVYPTKTFPNHYTIVTGLYPESHGIIDNNMFDFNISKTDRFKIGSDIIKDPRWWGGEPIWLTAQKQNVTSASFFWVGSDIPIQGSYPDLFKYYSGSVPYSSRVSTIVEWMQLPADRRPDLLLMYFDEPDHQAHTSGPFTPPVDEQIQRVDRILGELMDSLYQHDLHHCVNLIVLSDHGFSSLSCDQVIQMNDYFNQTEKNDLYFFYGPFGRVSNTYQRSRNGSIYQYNGKPPMSVPDVQDHLQCVNHLKVYAKTDLPVRHHYVNNDRIDNIILDPAINWTVSDKLNTRYCRGGSHGWDNIYRAMQALFVGYGPAFKNGETVEAFENIELYNMIADVLGIQPSPNNGTEGSLDHLLWQTFNRTRQAAASYMSSNVSVTSPVNCSCMLEPGQSVQAIAQTLNSQNISSIEQTALPFGAPLLMRSAMANISLLYQPTHVTAYSTAHRLPLWVSTTVSSTMLKASSSERCVVTDPRLPSQDQCSSLFQQPVNISIKSLLPEGYDLGSTASLLSSHIPMYDSFYTDVWQTLQTYLRNWSVGYQDLNIVAGSVFDGNNDGLADTPEGISRLNVTLPTHIFVIASRCGNSSQPLERCSSVKTLTFILPQVDTSKRYNCQTIEDYLSDNKARVRDVELMTDLHFFPKLPFTQAVAMRTYLPDDFWPV